MIRSTRKSFARNLLHTFAWTLLALTAASPASADEWLVVPAATGSDSWITATLTKLNAHLSEQGASVWAATDATTTFEQRESTPSVELSDRDIEAWVERSGDAIRHLARGDYTTALEELTEAQRVSRNAAEELNKKQEQAEIVLDTCLYMVRALLETGNRSEAKSQARECAQLVPRGEPDPLMHPPQVMELYRDASNGGPEQSGVLRVESDPLGCTVRLNGVDWGETPLQVDDLILGRYGVQVQCGDDEPSRIHPVELVPAGAQLSIDLRFDQAIETAPVLYLRYDEWPEDARRRADAAAIASVLPTQVVVLATMPTSEVMELEALDAQGKPLAFARIASTPGGPSHAAAAAAVRGLLERKCQDLTGAAPVTVECETHAAPALSETNPPAMEVERPRGQFIAGVTLASAGSAALITAYGLYGASNGKAADNMIADPSSLNQSKWLNLRFGMFYTGVGGSAALITAMPLALPYRAKPPWWAWLSGGVGLGLAATSIALAVTAPAKPTESRPANPQAHVDRAKRTDAAFLAGITAAPLLTMPLVYLFRTDAKKPKAELNPGIYVHRNGGTLSLSGRF